MLSALKFVLNIELDRTETRFLDGTKFIQSRNQIWNERGIRIQPKNNAPRQQIFPSVASAANTALLKDGRAKCMQSTHWIRYWNDFQHLQNAFFF